MTKAELHVCDETRDAHVCERVYPLDSARTPFNVLVRHLSEISQGGVWLKPFLGLIPQMPGLPPIEILLLTEKLEVVECIRELPENGISDVNSRVASALIVPASTIESAKVSAGDRIRICDVQTRVEWDCSSEEPRARGRHCRCFTKEADLNDGASRTLQIEAAISAVQAPEDKKDDWTDPPKRKKIRERLLHWLAGYEEDTNRRRTPRSRFPKLVAYYWTGGTPKAFKVGDVGPTGFYLLTSDRWTLGTRLIVTFQRTDAEIDSADGTITMPCTVIRTAADGVGFSFVPGAAVNPHSGEVVPANEESRGRLNRFLEQVISQARQDTA